MQQFFVKIKFYIIDINAYICCRNKFVYFLPVRCSQVFRRAIIQIMTRPLKNHISHKLCSRPSRRDFYSGCFPGKTCAELTIVNKPRITNYIPISYKAPISPAASPVCTKVNKCSYFGLIITVNSILKLTHYRISILPH